MDRNFNSLGTYKTKLEAGVVWDAASVWRSMKAPGKRVLAAKWIALLVQAGIEAWAWVSIADS